jgi:hypothetical protein
MARQRNPRCVALEMLRSIRRNVNDMVVSWSEDQKIYDGGFRKREYHEKIENNPEEWKRLVEYMDAVILEATAVHDYAKKQRDWLTLTD